MKIHWEVSDLPTGRYRSFQRRGWPMGWSDKSHTHALVSLRCDDEYRSAQVRTGDHKPLRVYVAIKHRAEERHEKGTWSWRKLKGTWPTLLEAKAAAQKFYDEHPKLFLTGGERP